MGFKDSKGKFHPTIKQKKPVSFGRSQNEKNGKYYEPTMRDTMKSHGFTDKQSDQMEDQITKQLAELRTGRKDMTDDMIVTTDKDGIRTYNDPDVYHGRGEVVKGSVRYG